MQLRSMIVVAALLVTIVRTVAAADPQPAPEQATLHAWRTVTGSEAGEQIGVAGQLKSAAQVATDVAGIAASTKSACAGAGSGVSHVVEEITNDQERAKSTIRISLGEDTTREEMIYVVSVLVEFVAKMKPLTQ